MTRYRVYAVFKDSAEFEFRYHNVKQDEWTTLVRLIGNLYASNYNMEEAARLRGYMESLSKKVEERGEGAQKDDK